MKLTPKDFPLIYSLETTDNLTAQGSVPVGVLSLSLNNDSRFDLKHLTVDSVLIFDDRREMALRSTRFENVAKGAMPCAVVARLNPLKRSGAALLGGYCQTLPLHIRGVTVSGETFALVPDPKLLVDYLRCKKKARLSFFGIVANGILRPLKKILEPFRTPKVSAQVSQKCEPNG